MQQLTLIPHLLPLCLLLYLDLQLLVESIDLFYLLNQLRVLHLTLPELFGHVTHLIDLSTHLLELFPQLPRFLLLHRDLLPQQPNLLLVLLHHKPPFLLSALRGPL